MKNRAFTYIEVMITLAVVAVLFIPMMRLFSHSLGSSAISGEIITAVNLGRWEMERVRNLGSSKAQLAALGSGWYPAPEEPALEVDKTKWRIQRSISGGEGPLEIKVDVYTAENLKKPVASLATLVEDAVWVEERRT